ncbi:hypothetical protein AC578_5671 [Pseudocercospora eumusae]|uniref:Uncharacterized protein n=1 Tax=Pseudocercospora eumusae TaxID=321146 RepID=A0A139H3C8_9PEZI|nr:hypothetical protein AC578_5671 [Pseudocercospora eumusae]
MGDVAASMMELNAKLLPLDKALQRALLYERGSSRIETAYRIFEGHICLLHFENPSTNDSQTSKHIEDVYVDRIVAKVALERKQNVSLAGPAPMASPGCSSSSIIVDRSTDASTTRSRLPKVIAVDLRLEVLTAYFDAEIGIKFINKNPLIILKAGFAPGFEHLVIFKMQLAHDSEDNDDKIFFYYDIELLDDKWVRPAPEAGFPQSLEDKSVADAAVFEAQMSLWNKRDKENGISRYHSAATCTMHYDRAWQEADHPYQREVVRVIQTPTNTVKTACYNDSIHGTSLTPRTFVSRLGASLVGLDRALYSADDDPSNDWKHSENDNVFKSRRGKDRNHRALCRLKARGIEINSHNTRASATLIEELALETSDQRRSARP